MSPSWTHSGSVQSVPQDVAAEQLDSALGSTVAPWAHGKAGGPIAGLGGASVLVLTLALVVLVALRILAGRRRQQARPDPPAVTGDPTAPSPEPRPPRTMKLPPDVAALLARLDREGPERSSVQGPPRGPDASPTATEGGGGIEVWIGR